MTDRQMKTTSFKLPTRHVELLKQVAHVRALRNIEERCTVSDILRELIEAAVPSFETEIETFKRGRKR